MPVLTVEKGPNAGKRYKFDGDVFFGSDQRAQIHIPDRQVLPRHARITRKGEQFFIQDLTNTNTVAVNGRIISRERPIAFGDKIRIGLTWFAFEPDGGVAAAAPAQAPGRTSQAPRAAKPAAPAAPPAASGSVVQNVLKDYQILEELPKQGVGDLYRAKEMALDRVVMLRILPPGLIGDNPGVERKFREEVQAIVNLNHENIAKLLDFGMHSNYIYYSTEVIEGTSLELMMTTDGAFTYERALLIARDMARGLEHAHRRRVAHQDLKPKNITISVDRVVITDFGPTKVLSEITSDGMTSVGLVGSLEYASPEQCSAGQVDHRTDIYSLGVILYQMLAAKLPFEGETPYDLIEGHISGVPTPLSKWRPDIPEPIERIVTTALQKDPAKRYQACREFISDIENCIRDLELIKNIESEQEDIIWMIGKLIKVNMFVSQIEDKIRHFTLVDIGDSTEERVYKLVKKINSFAYRWSVVVFVVGLYVSMFFVTAKFLKSILPSPF